MNWFDSIKSISTDKTMTMIWEFIFENVLDLCVSTARIKNE